MRLSWLSDRSRARRVAHLKLRRRAISLRYGRNRRLNLQYVIGARVCAGDGFASGLEQKELRLAKIFECGRGVADPRALPRLLLQRCFLGEALLVDLPFFEEVPAEEEVVVVEVKLSPSTSTSPRCPPRRTCRGGTRCGTRRARRGAHKGTHQGAHPLRLRWGARRPVRRGVAVRAGRQRQSARAPPADDEDRDPPIIDAHRIGIGAHRHLRHSQQPQHRRRSH